jgi:hypothetical protein
MAACRLASRGKTMADASYNHEVDSIKKALLMQSGRKLINLLSNNFTF